MTYTPVAREYKRQGVKGGLLEVDTRDEAGVQRRYVFLVPSWVPGLVAASKSKGRAFGKLIRGCWPSTRLDN